MCGVARLFKKRLRALKFKELYCHRAELLAITYSRRPGEHLTFVLVQNPQAIRVLWQVQRLEERLGFHLRPLQISRDVRNPIERGVRVVPRSNAMELNSEDYHLASMRNESGL